MSVKLALSVYSVNNKNLSSSEKHVLVRLALWGDDDGKKIYPSYERISKETGLSKRTVINVTNSLTKKGFLKKKKRRKDNKNDTNHYVIDIEKLKALEGRGSETDSLGSEFIALGGATGSLGVVQPLHHPSAMAAPNSKVIVREKVKTHSKGDFVSSVDGVCASSLSLDELQQGENDRGIEQTSTQSLQDEIFLKKGLSFASQLACSNHNADQPINGFEDLSSLWIKKEGFNPAQKIYNTIVPGKTSAKKILESAKQKMVSLEKKYPNEDERIRYCPQLDNWLQKEGYNDDPHVPENQSVPSKLSLNEIKKEEARKRAEEGTRQLMKTHCSSSKPQDLSGENQR